MPPVEVIEKRTRSSKTHSLGGRKFSWDGTIGSIHYEDNGWQEIDNYFEPAVAPWDWQMLKADYHIRVKEDFTAGQIIEFEVQGETVQIQPMALEWTNDLDQIQPIAMPHEVVPTITNPEVDLLPAVGMPSHQGTIRWDDAYGEGIDFEWKATSTRLLKTLEIENLNNLPIPEQYILDGGNPVLRLNLIFDPSDVDIYVDSEVWDTKAKVQTFNIIEFHKDGEVLWGFMPLKYWGSYVGNDEELLEANQGQSVATLEKRGNKLYISIRVPYEWLQSTVYPVFIDTDVTIQPSAKDTYMYKGAATTNYGTNTDIRLYDYTSPGRIVLEFDISGLGTVESFISSSFEIYLFQRGGGTGTKTVWVYKLTRTDWVETEATWNIYKTDSNWTDSGGDYVTSNPAGDSILMVLAEGYGWKTWDVLAIIQDAYDNTNPVEFLVKCDPETYTGGQNSSFWFYSSEYTTDPSLCPKLHIEYEAGVPPEGQPYISRVQGVQGMRSWGGI